MGVGGVVRRGDALSVGGWSSVVEVDLGSVLLRGGAQDLLGRSLAPGSPHTDHPDEKDEQDQEDDSSGNATGDVSKLGLLLALLAGERARALAVRVAVLVLQADALVAAEIEAVVAAVSVRTGSGIAGLALARVAVGLLDEEAVGVSVAESHFALADAAPVGALLAVGRALALGGSVWRALDAACLLGLVLVVASGTKVALVQGGVEVGAWLADGQRTVSAAC